MEPKNDIYLLGQISKNNKEAFDMLFRRYYTPLCRFALKITQEEEFAEEAVQLIFIHFWEHRKSIRIQQSVSAYLFKAVRLKVYEIFRTKQIKNKHEQYFADNQYIIEDDNPKEIDTFELSCLIWNAVGQLPQKCSEIFRLSRDEGLTYNEIAEHLGISVKTVENQMGIAFKKLREILYPTLKSKGWNTTKIDLLLTIICLQGIFDLTK